MDALNALVTAFHENPASLCGQGDPARAVLEITDREKRLRALTLGVVLSVFPSTADWQIVTGLADHWLLEPGEVAYRRSQEVLAAMRAQGLGGPRHNARVWWQICRGIQGRFRGSVRQMLRTCGDDALEVQRYLDESSTTFPVLSGAVMSAEWLDLVHRIGDVSLDRWKLLVVELSPGDQEAAAMFAAVGHLAHPLERRALRVWRDTCQGPGSEVCGLAACPRRNTLTDDGDVT